MRFGLVIVAAGRGERAGSVDGPKQYRPLARSTVIAETLACFSGTVVPADTICVVHADDAALFSASVPDPAKYRTVVGGATRQDSVLAGLEALAAMPNAPSHVMIHDAARPFVTTQLLTRLVDAAGQDPASGVLPVLPIVETVKQAFDGLVAATLPRASMFRAQTPQLFPLPAIVDLHRRAAAEGRHDFTDDAALFEWAQLPVRTVEGDAANIKLTYTSDFPMKITIPDIRTGNGYDVHRFGPGDRVTLCGIAIPHGQTLSGHSDADVALHALTDALLATCGAGDIGDHFPPSDPQWRGAASSIFLEHAAAIVREKGGTILNADVTLIAEAPKVAPHREAMCENLSKMLGIGRSRCSVKATTNEKMGFVGRAEGIAAIATASVHYGEIHE